MRTLGAKPIHVNNGLAYEIYTCYALCALKGIPYLPDGISDKEEREAVG
jgi:hypothetical protein